MESQSRPQYQGVFRTLQVVPITGQGSNTVAGSCGALKRAMVQASEKAVAQIGNDFVAKVANGHVLN